MQQTLLSQVAKEAGRQLQMLRECEMPAIARLEVADYALGLKVAEYLVATGKRTCLIDAQDQFNKSLKRFSWPNLFELQDEESTLVIVAPDKLENDFYGKKAIAYFAQEHKNSAVLISIRQ